MGHMTRIAVSTMPIPLRERLCDIAANGSRHAENDAAGQAASPRPGFCSRSIHRMSTT